MDTNIGRSFDKLVSHVFIKYSGCLIERTCEGYKAFGETYPTIEEAKKAIDERYILLGNSIK